MAGNCCLTNDRAANTDSHEMSRPVRLQNWSIEYLRLLDSHWSITYFMICKPAVLKLAVNVHAQTESRSGGIIFEGPTVYVRYGT
jgi:hypothetical protein